jgi:DNA-binding transcriptional regulator YiaG
MAKKIKVKIYDDMRQSLADALAYERGQKVDLRVTEIPAPPKVLKPREIRYIRESLHASQTVFPHYLSERASAKHRTTAPDDCQEEPNRSSAELMRLNPSPITGEYG